MDTILFKIILKCNFKYDFQYLRGVKKPVKKIPQIALEDSVYLMRFFAMLRMTIYFVAYITSFTALITRSAFGKLAAIKVGEYGSGTSAQVIRKTGASK
ncbi:hypothetical protein D3C87_546850 [compost metagenome]